MADYDRNAIREQIRLIEEQIAEARARIPKHDVPAALVAELDDLDQELAELRARLLPKSLDEQIAEVEARLTEARARLPKHSIPAALIAELDDLELELAELRRKRDEG
jgi:hypothetical protein